MANICFSVPKVLWPWQCVTWTCCLVSRPSCSLSTRWCPRCRSSPGSGCRRAALRLTGAGGAGWSGEPEEARRWSCGLAPGCRTWPGSRRATRSTRSWGGSESRAAPPTDTELRPLPSVWARQGDDAAPRSPADLQGGGHWSVHTLWFSERGKWNKGGSLKRPFQNQNSDISSYL